MVLAVPPGQIVPSHHLLIGPVVALVAVGVLALLLRWTFGDGGCLPTADADPARGRPRSRWRARRRRPRSARPDYGLLVPVAGAASDAEAQAVRRLIGAAGVRATVARGGGVGAPADRPYVVLVFPADLARAASVLDSSR